MACGKLIITALVSNCDFVGRDSYSQASQSLERLAVKFRLKWAKYVKRLF
ncbi:MAG: hypothetical protein QE493_06810 [Verrucomicrobiae bacterium]|nr:hypothetical protein [Verrucomicrobiae bacterium]